MKNDETLRMDSGPGAEYVAPLGLAGVLVWIATKISRLTALEICGESFPASGRVVCQKFESGYIEFCYA